MQSCLLKQGAQTRDIAVPQVHVSALGLGLNPMQVSAGVSKSPTVIGRSALG